MKTGTARKQPKRTFWSIAGLLLILTLFGSVYFGVFINARVQGERQRTEIARSFKELEQVCYRIDDLFTLLSDQVHTILYKDSGFALLVNPYTESGAREKTIESMNAKTKSSEYFDEILLYSTVSDTVYSSRNTHVPLKFSAYKELIAELYKDQKEVTADEMGVSWNYRYYQGNHYMVFNVCMPERIGLVVCHLNGTAVRQYMDLADTEGKVLFIVEGDTVLPRISTYRKEANLSTVTDSVCIDNSDDTLTDEKQWYRVVSSVTGWTLLMPVNETAFGNDWYRNIPAVLPVVIVFLLAGAAISLLSAKKIYDPIGQMMELTSKAKQPFPADGMNKNELAYLTNIFHSTLDANDRYREYAESMSSEITEQLFSKLVTGRAVEKEHARNVLAAVNRADLMEGLFRCMVIRIHTQSDSDLEFHVVVRSIVSKAAALSLDGGEKWLITPGREEIAVICCFPAGTPTASAEAAADAFTEKLDAAQKEMGLDCVSAGSPCFIGLMRMHDNYRAALEQLNYMEYRKESEMLGGSEEELLEESAVPDSLLTDGEKESIARQLQKAQSGDTETARFTFAELIAQHAQATDTLEEAVRIVTEALAYLGDCVSKLPLENAEDAELTEWRKQTSDVANAKTVAEAINSGKVLCTVPFRIASQQGRKNTLRYIESAKNYIDGNYANNLMSLNDVAENIGISPHYLSRLFTEVEGMTFVSYVSRKRIEQACRLLKLSKLTVSEIGFQCGFASVQSFCRTFKKYTEKTPGQYKEETGESDA